MAGPTRNKRRMSNDNINNREIDLHCHKVIRDGTDEETKPIDNNRRTTKENSRYNTTSPLTKLCARSTAIAAFSFPTLETPKPTIHTSDQHIITSPKKKPSKRLPGNTKRKLFANDHVDAGTQRKKTKTLLQDDNSRDSADGNIIITTANTIWKELRSKLLL